MLNCIVDKYDSAYHGSIKMKPINVKSNSYAEYNIDSKKKLPKF